MKNVAWEDENLSDQRPKTWTSKFWFQLCCIRRVTFRYQFHRQWSIRLSVTGALVRVDHSSRRFGSRLKHKHLLTWFHLAPSCVEHLMASFVISCFVRHVSERWVMNEYRWDIDPPGLQSEGQISHVDRLAAEVTTRDGGSSWNLKPRRPLQILKWPSDGVECFYFNAICKRHRDIKPLLLVGSLLPSMPQSNMSIIRCDWWGRNVGSITEKIASLKEQFTQKWKCQASSVHPDAEE